MDEAIPISLLGVGVISSCYQNQFQESTLTLQPQYPINICFGKRITSTSIKNYGYTLDAKNIWML